MIIKNKVSIELLDWIREELENKKSNISYKKLKKIMIIAIEHNTLNKKIFKPGEYYVYDENKNRLYYHYDYYCESGILSEHSEVILK